MLLTLIVGSVRGEELKLKPFLYEENFETDDPFVDWVNPGGGKVNFKGDSKWDRLIKLH